MMVMTIINSTSVNAPRRTVLECDANWILYSWLLLLLVLTRAKEPDREIGLIVAHRDTWSRRWPDSTACPRTYHPSLPR